MVKSFLSILTKKDCWFVIPFFLVLLMFGGLNFYLGYKLHQKLTEPKPIKEQLYKIVDANGVVHATKCNGYELINADTVELCEGIRIKYNRN